jgi:hypothetical protein
MNKPALQHKDLERSRIVLELLESVQRDGEKSQRTRASQFGVALGLVNAYLNYCVRKGYIRVKKIPAKRYFYYLTPKGFAEKSRLAPLLISNSFRSFRQAREEYGAAFLALKRAGCHRIVLSGRSELAEIATLCAAENEIVIGAILSNDEGLFLGLPMVRSLEHVPGGFDGFAITDLNDPGAAYEAAVRVLGRERVAAPAILGITQKIQAAE